MEVRVELCQYLWPHDHRRALVDACHLTHMRLDCVRPTSRARSAPGRVSIWLRLDCEKLYTLGRRAWICRQERKVLGQDLVLSSFWPGAPHGLALGQAAQRFPQWHGLFIARRKSKRML